MAVTLPPCGHATDSGQPNVVRCDLNLPGFGPTPTLGSCYLRCDKNPDKGMLPPELAQVTVSQQRGRLDGIPLPGDVIEKIAHRIGADRLAKLWERWTGKPCGCAERRDKINAATKRLLGWLGNRA